MGGAAAMDTENGVTAKEEMNDQGDDEQQDFDIETQKALEEMDALQNEMDILSINGEAEQMKVEMEYIKQRKPFTDKRNEIIRKMPNFWINSFMNHPVTHSLIAEEEEDCMQYLQFLDILITTGLVYQLLDLHLSTNRATPLTLCSKL